MGIVYNIYISTIFVKIIFILFSGTTIVRDKKNIYTYNLSQELWCLINRDLG